MKITRGRIAAILLGMVLAFPAFFGASWAREQVVSGYPTFTEGDELWGRKTGTTNTKEDVTVTSGSLNVNVTGSASPKPATVDTSFTAQAADFTVEAATANLRIKGWSIRESAASAAVATVVIRHDADGTCDGTAVVAFVELSANQSLQQDYGPDGEAIPNGLCVDVIAGTVDFVAKLKTEASL
jgi:hypothetical protein